MPHNPEITNLESFMNHGAIPGRRPGDFIAGQLPYEVKNPSADWSQYIPTNEPQNDPGSPGKDRFNCVTQAHHNVVENQMMFDIQTGRMPQIHQDWLRRRGYFDDNGKINFSEGFNTITNGTIPGVGNWLYIVADDGRTNGLIPNRLMPDDPSMPNDVYYDKRRVTQEMINLGREFLLYFSLPWEWIGNHSNTVKYHLFQAPLQVVIPGHSIVEVAIIIKNMEDYAKVNDSYPPYLYEMTTPHNQVISDVMKVLVQYKEIKQGVIMVFFKVKNTAAIWLLTNGVWIGFADQGAFDRYVAGRPFSIVELDQAEFDKVSRSTEVIKT